MWSGPPVAPASLVPTSTHRACPRTPAAEATSVAITQRSFAVAAAASSDTPGSPAATARAPTTRRSRSAVQIRQASSMPATSPRSAAARATAATRASSAATRGSSPTAPPRATAVPKDSTVSPAAPASACAAPTTRTAAEEPAVRPANATTGSATNLRVRRRTRTARALRAKRAAADTAASRPTAPTASVSSPAGPPAAGQVPSRPAVEVPTMTAAVAKVSAVPPTMRKTEFPYPTFAVPIPPASPHSPAVECVAHTG